MKVVLAGVIGALGMKIAADLASRGDDVVILTRGVRAGVPFRQLLWDGRTVGPWADELADAAVINLVGELVDRHPAAMNIGLLTRSRVAPTRTLVEVAGNARVWLQASNLAVYGDVGEEVLDETAEPADGPPQTAGVAQAWEAAAAGTEARQVVLRMSAVFDRDTATLNRLANRVSWGLDGPVGDLRQWISWLHIADLLAVVRRALDDSALAGVLHVASPNPVRSTELMDAVRDVVPQPSEPPHPKLQARLGAMFPPIGPLALSGPRCVPRRLLDYGFRFAYPELRPALRDLL
jgi:uncharacterized protein